MKAKMGLVILVLLLMSVFVVAQGGDDNSNLIACGGEGQGIPLNPSYQCCEGLVPIAPTATLLEDGTCQDLLGSSVCSNCGNGICEAWENKCNCEKDCAPAILECSTNNDCKEIFCPDGGFVHEVCQDGKCILNAKCPSTFCTDEYAPVCAELPVQCIRAPCNPIRQTYSNACYAKSSGATIIYEGECRTGLKIKEEVSCVFLNTGKEQSCYASNGASCTVSAVTPGARNQTSCTAIVTGEKGEKIVWKSSCGGYAYTILDGQDETAEFECGNVEPETVTEQVKCIFKNSTERQKCYAYYEGEKNVSSTNSTTTTSSSNNPSVFSCTTGENGNYESCVVDVTAKKGTKLTWKSSCNGYAYTIVDGDSEYAKFDCDSTKPPVCVCTKEYAPVCGTIKVCATMCKDNARIDSNETSTCTESCYEQRKTFSNSCEAKCAGVTSVQEGVCAQTCPRYSQPYCPGGKIEIIYDERGCEKPRCVSEESEHFTGAYWKCSNGKEFKETNSCMPVSYWKEKARRTCAQYSTKCGVDDVQTTSTTTGNFILDIVATATRRINPTETQAEMPVEVKCVGGQVYVEAFEIFGSCTPGSEKCKYYVNKEGCKVKECVNGVIEINCPEGPTPVTNEYRKAYFQCYSGKEFYEGGESSCKQVDLWKQYASEACNNECSEVETTCSIDSNVCMTSEAKCGVNSFQVSAPCYDGRPIICSNQNEEEMKAAKEKCYKNGGEMRVEFDSQGCRSYSCGVISTQCQKESDFPKEKILYCEERGGKMITKTDSEGCLVYVECAGEKINDSNASINKEVISDQMKLLDLAIKLETAKIELEKTAEKIREIAKYYEEDGKEADANRFLKAANILEAAANKLDEIKIEIKENIDNFDEARAKKIREIIRNIKEGLLKEALLEMLG